MDAVSLPIASEMDIIAARQHGRALGSRLGFSSSELTLIATAISEIARNIVSYAGAGQMTVSVVGSAPKLGVLVVAEDRGPGIADLTLAMQDGYSTHKSLGLGLPGAKRLMDEFEIQSELGKGTVVRMIKWKRK